MDFREKNKRSLSKTITYELLKLLSGSAVVFFYTRQFDITISIAVASIILGTIIYYVHERIWNKIKWGKEQANTNTSE